MELLIAFYTKFVSDNPLMMCAMRSNCHFFVKVFHQFGKIANSLKSCQHLIFHLNKVVHRKGTKLFKFVE